MIYKFNEYYSTLRYPKMVGLKEFMNKKQTHRMTDFSASERKSITDIVYKKRGRASFSSCFVEIYYTYINEDGEFGFDNVEIVKLVDDWFTIIIEGYSATEYFICDEFEEVISWLESKVIT